MSKTGRLAGVLGPLLALVLVAAIVLPAHASVPAIPHAFTGQVNVADPPGLVPPGRVVEVFVDGIYRTQTEVDSDSWYTVLVRGTKADQGKTVSFKVSGRGAVPTAKYEAGEVTTHHLTVDKVPYALTMAAAPPAAGVATDVTGASPYVKDDQVSIKAEELAGYRFAGWTAPAGQFADASAAETVFTMPPQAVTVTANFAPAYQLTLAADPVEGGTPLDLTDEAPYIEGAQVEIRGQANPGYQFSSWTASAGQLEDPDSRTTIFTMPGEDATVTASYEPADTYGLTLVANPAAGGNPVDLTDEGPYFVNTVVIIQAQPNPGYTFLYWTAPAGVIGNPNNPTTTFTMPAETVEVTAHYEAIPYTLTVVANPDTMGTATDVTNASPYIVGDVVTIRAQANEGYAFVNWTAPAGSFADAGAAETTFVMPAQDVTVTANFVEETAEPGEYTLTMAVQPSPMGGQVEPSVGTHLKEEGESVTVRVLAPGSGYQFLYWMSSPGVNFGNASATTTSFTMPASNVTVTAVFGQAATDPPISPCFIATAAYGTPTAAEIDVLREFRDAVLLKSAAGSAFVDLYYRLSPPIAEAIAENGFVRTLVRELLVDPAVWIVEAAGGIWRK